MSLDELLDLIEMYHLVMNTLSELGNSTEELQKLAKLLTD